MSAVTQIGKAIENALHAAGNFTGGKIPTVAVHLVGGVKSTKSLAAGGIKLNEGLMRQIEGFLVDAGIPVQEGLKVLGADGASNALVLTANGLEKNAARQVVIKLTDSPGFYVQKPHLTGDALLLKEDLLPDAVQRAFASAQNGNPVLVRIEPRMLPVDKVIEAMPIADKMGAHRQFKEALVRRGNEKGLLGLEVKPPNFGIPVGSKTPGTMEELLAHPGLKSIDTESFEIPLPQHVREMAKPLPIYQPQYRDTPLKHIDEMFPVQELPTLQGAAATAATQQALGTSRPPALPGA